MHDSIANLPLISASLLAAIGMTACAPLKGSVAASPTSDLHAVATIDELMEGQIDPAADALWDSVAFIASASGTEDRRPRTDADWADVRNRALMLIEAANLLAMPGRSVKHGAGPVGIGELEPTEIQRRIEASPAAFARFAGVLQESALGALSAIDAHDADALMNAGGIIDAACEVCHLTYWYPNQSRSGT